MKPTFKIKENEEVFKVERIDYFNKYFLVFYEMPLLHFKCIKNNQIEYIKDFKGNYIYKN